MGDNQKLYEIIRDLGYAVERVEKNETIWFNVRNDGDGFFTARCSGVMPQGLSETSSAIERAYKVTRGVPDVRDVRIKELEEKLGLLSSPKCD